MDVTGNCQNGYPLAGCRRQPAGQHYGLKEGSDSQESATALIEAIPHSSANVPNLPPNLGRNINTDCISLYS